MHIPSFIFSLPILSTFQTEFSDHYHHWRPPKETDLRSPCPGLNTLANHGYLPRDGRHLTASMVNKVCLDVFGITEDSLLVAAYLALLSSPAVGTFTLADIRLHNTIEHDASLSREDFALGDNYHFNETIFQTLANSNPGVDYYNATSAGQVQKQRLADQQRANPNITNTAKEFGIRTFESSLYLSTMGDPLTGAAPKEFVNILFREERLPIKEGWRKSATSITLDTLGAVQQVIAENSDWAPGPGNTIPSITIFAPPNSSVVF